MITGCRGGVQVSGKGGFEHIADYKEELEALLTTNFGWLIPKPFRCDYNIVIAFKGEEKGGVEPER